MLCTRSVTCRDCVTGPMYVKYNAVLRGFAAEGSTTYSVTLHLICSALRKLSRISPPPPGLVVYRGNGGMAMPADFLEPDARGCAGGVECALMSTSPDRNVALGYSGVLADRELPTVFEIEVGKTSIGADVSFLSQFEAEKEYLYAPLAYLEVAGQELSVHEGKELSVLRIQLTVNQRAMTVEQAERSRLDFLQGLASNLEWEVRHWAKKHNLLARLVAEIRGMRSALQCVVTTADVATLNKDNLTFKDVSVVWQCHHHVRGPSPADGRGAVGARGGGAGEGRGC